VKHEVDIKEIKADGKKMREVGFWKQMTLFLFLFVMGCFYFLCEKCFVQKK